MIILEIYEIEKVYVKNTELKIVKIFYFNNEHYLFF